MIQGLLVSRTVYVAAKVGIADLLKEGPRWSDELARLTADTRRKPTRMARPSIDPPNSVDAMHFRPFAAPSTNDRNRVETYAFSRGLLSLTFQPFIASNVKVAFGSI
jgi:hypothetical protein